MEGLRQIGGKVAVSNYVVQASAHRHAALRPNRESFNAVHPGVLDFINIILPGEAGFKRPFQDDNSINQSI